MIEQIDKDTLLDENNVISNVETVQIESDNSENEIDINESKDFPQPNCLALTVRKDYNLIIVKNIFNASGRLSWKIVLATVVLNFLNMIF